MILELGSGKVTGYPCWTQAEDHSLTGQLMDEKRPLWHDEVTDGRKVINRWEGHHEGFG